MYSTSTKVLGYHGTYPKNIEGIVQLNFHETKNHEIWLGDGVYFFIDGIGFFKPVEYAKGFAKDQCWDNSQKKHTEPEICVLEAAIRINSDRFLDLTDRRGNQLFNEFRQKTIEKIAESGKKVIGQYKDTEVFRVMREVLGIEFVKANVYIKFGVQRVGYFESKVPNVTILAVNNPTKNIQKPSIKVVYKEEI